MYFIQYIRDIARMDVEVYSVVVFSQGRGKSEAHMDLLWLRS